MPDGALPVLLVLTGLALIFGILTRKAAFSFVGVILLLAFFTPFVEAFIQSLPLWLTIMIGFVFIFSVVKVVFYGLFGKGATDQFLGQVLYGVFTLPFRLLGRRRT